MLRGIIEDVFAQYFLKYSFREVTSENFKLVYNNEYCSLSFWTDYSELVATVIIVDEGEILEYQIKDVWHAFNELGQFMFNEIPQWKEAAICFLKTLEDYIPDLPHGDLTWITKVEENITLSEKLVKLVRELPKDSPIYIKYKQNDHSWWQELNEVIKN